MADQIIMKRCLKCKQIKSLSEFYPHKGYRFGVRTCCKVCQNKATATYHKTAQGREVSRKAVATYQKTTQGKKVSRKASAKYRHSPKGQAYAQSPKAKELRRKADGKFERSPKGRIVQRRKYLRHPLENKARSVVGYAIRSGKLPKACYLQCHCCGTQAKEWHHHKGYEPQHWLDVIPLCIICHKKSITRFSDFVGHCSVLIFSVLLAFCAIHR